jgi:replicative superfamily II helicase
LYNDLRKGVSKMIDFTKRLSVVPTEKKINPTEIYDSLDRESIAGPLRPVQQRVLEKWFNEKRTEKDLIVKLHTGAGKTLIGLLMALSCMNESHHPSLYVCPNV